MHFPSDPVAARLKRSRLAQLGEMSQCTLTGNVLSNWTSQQMNQARSWVAENGWTIVKEVDGKSVIKVAGPGATPTSSEPTEVREYFLVKLLP